VAASAQAWRISLVAVRFRAAQTYQSA